MPKICLGPASYLRMGEAKGYTGIERYGIIGDCRSAALVCDDGTIEWLCWPRFDSGTVFASILDCQRGGNWSILCDGLRHCSRSYLDATNVLVTRMECDAGVVEVTDLMPVTSEEHKRKYAFADHELLRKVQCVEGAVEFQSVVAPRPDFASRTLKIRARGALGYSFRSDIGVCYLNTSHPSEHTESEIRTRVRLETGETAWFSLTYSVPAPAVIPPLGDGAELRLKQSIAWWRQWSQQMQYDGPWRDQVLRSALALKLMIYSPSGAVVAAPTTSLPERIGGDLNWDYRFCWLRDASLTIRSLLGLGFRDEADSFIGWMLNATATTLPRVRVLYNLFGLVPGRERTADNLEGYKGSRPVRIGNMAVEQLQLDTYGEIIDAVAQFVYDGGFLDQTMRRDLRKMGDYVCKHWHEPDEGIWEPRQPASPHTHSRLLCWTALDRLIGMAEKGIIDGPIPTWKKERENIRQAIVEQAWDERKKSYVNVLPGHDYGRDIDASLLLMSFYGFEEGDSERMQRTYAAVCRELAAGDSLLYRYRAKPEEGAFGVCCFWQAEFLALKGGTLEHASEVFERLLGYANDLGLFAEEIDPQTGAAIGNFPQAFTHVGLISAAISIKERMKGEKQLKHREEGAQRSAA